MTTYRKSGAFLTAKDDPALLYIFTDEFEAYWSFEDFKTVKARDAIDQVCSRERTGNGAAPAAAFDEVIDKQCQKVVGIDELGAFVEHAEPIGVAVGREPDLQPVLLHQCLQLSQLFIRGL